MGFATVNAVTADKNRIHVSRSGFELGLRLTVGLDPGQGFNPGLSFIKLIGMNGAIM